MTRPRPVWFREGPAPQRSHTGRDGAEARLAIENNRSWAVKQAPVLPPQLQHAVEFAVMPHALMHDLAYRLDQAGALLPELLRRNVLDRDEALELGAAIGQLCCLNVADAQVMAYRLEYGSSQALTTMFDNTWLALLCPIDADPSLSQLSPASAS